MELVELGRNICNVRRSLDMTQEEVALELDISITAYAKIERGETNVSFLRLTQIADLFKVPISRLVCNSNDYSVTDKEILKEIKLMKEEIVCLKNFIEKTDSDN